jgi:uncharacterized HAD superfamily protein
MSEIEPERIAFDIDGVVADTMSLFLEIARDRFRITGISKEEITTYMLEDCLSLPQAVIDAIIEELLEMSHWAPLKPMPGAVRTLSMLAGMCESLTFVTARPDGRAIQEWLCSTVPVPRERINVFATGSFEAKTEILLSAGKDWFVEDRLETCFNLQEAGIRPVVFRQPWNRRPHPFMEVGSWEELSACIRRP